MVKIKWDGHYLSRSKWESDEVILILNEFIRSGYIVGYNCIQDPRDKDTVLIYIVDKKEEEKS